MRTRVVCYSTNNKLLWRKALERALKPQPRRPWWERAGAFLQELFS